MTGAAAARAPGLVGAARSGAVVARRRGRLALLAALLACAGGCAGGDLAIKVREVRAQLRQARDQGAYRCAPRELALGDANVEFAEHELEQGDYFRAKDHLRIALVSAREALRLSPPERCSEAAPKPLRKPPSPPSRADGDGDGILDTEDKCPAESEDKDGFQDADGCPELDNDGDGIPDALDKCPLQAEDRDGFQDADGCPDPDNDLDGVPDVMDRCPLEPEDRDGIQDEDGCPDPDNDLDGVLDAEDRCPNEPGPPGSDGCPRKFELITVTKEKIEIRQKIFFATGKAAILPRSFPLLDQVAAALRDRPTMKLRIEGHTDSRGQRQANIRLSRARAESVRAYLSGHGVAADRLEAVGFGPDQPIESNRTSSGREMNRRVEFFITQQ